MSSSAHKLNPQPHFEYNNSVASILPSCLATVSSRLWPLEDAVLGALASDIRSMICVRMHPSCESAIKPKRVWMKTSAWPTFTNQNHIPTKTLFTHSCRTNGWFMLAVHGGKAGTFSTQGWALDHAHSGSLGYCQMMRRDIRCNVIQFRRTNNTIHWRKKQQGTIRIQLALLYVFQLEKTAGLQCYEEKPWKSWHGVWHVFLC